MTVPPQDSQQYEIRRRIVDCRERLRRARSSARKANGRTHAKQTEGAADGARGSRDAQKRPGR